MRTKKEIADTIIYYLIDNDMTVEEFCNLIKASKASCYRWMNGNSMSNKYYIKLLKLFENYNASSWVLEQSKEELEQHMFNS